MLNYLKALVLYPAAETYLKRDIRSKLKTLRDEHRSTLTERESIQKKLLHSTLTHASECVPYYRDLFKSIQFKPDSVMKSLEVMHELPVLDKDILREQGKRMLSERYAGKHLHERHTNGSTGLVTQVWYDQESLDWTAAVNLFASELAGRSHTKKEVHLSTAFRNPLSIRDQRIERIKCWALNRVNILTTTFEPGDLNLILQSLKRVRPFSIQGHPSTIYFLALHAKRTNQEMRGIFKVYESTGESLTKNVVQTIEEVFECRVCNRYGNAEFGVVAHSFEDFQKLEVFDTVVYPEAHSLGNGLEEIILTSLRNNSMPMIRYRTGDVGELDRSNGRTYISRLTGRVHDLVELNGKTYPTHYVKDILERIGGVDEFQIVESKSLQTKTLKIIPNHLIDKMKLERELISYFGNSLTPQYTDFNGLVMQGWRDKFRYLIVTE